MQFKILLEKENFKFSCSHFTILSSTSAERLHGHNYYVRVELDVDQLDPEFGFAFDFNVVKPLIKKILDEFDERVLLPERSRYLKIQTLNSTVSATLSLGGKEKSYNFPEEDVKFLATVNITSEELARLIADRICDLLRPIETVAGRLKKIHVMIEETRGQGVVYSRKIQP